MREKNVLDGVPVMHYGNPSAVCYIGSVMRFMECIGDPVEQDELFALSGVGLCFPWRFASSCDEVSVIPDIPSRTFEAFGYDSEYFAKDALKDKNACFDKIKKSIDSGRPVIGFGITVKMPMSCLITGYDENGVYTRSFWPPEGCEYNSEEYFYSVDWYENCAGLLFVGEKKGERLKGKAAYDYITDWALRFRCCPYSVKAEGKDIYLNQYAYDEMVKWLHDDAMWENPVSDGKEQFLKQCGLLLLGHYRCQLYSYLKKLDSEYPDVVNKPVFSALERIMSAMTGSEYSDLRLDVLVSPELADFSAMKKRELREKTAEYVRKLRDDDNCVQWALFMPDCVKNQMKDFTVESFEYKKYPAMRFIGVEGEEYDNVEKRAAAMKMLDEMKEYKSDFDYDILFMHHYGLECDMPWHGVWGRFMKADTPVPDGYIYFDMAAECDGKAGPPYVSQFAFARFTGTDEALHSRENFDSDAMYDVTRNIILGDDVCIPYPEKYWTAEVFLNGCENSGTAYLFSTADW